MQTREQGWFDGDFRECTSCSREQLASEMIENAASAGEIGEELFFGAEFRGMGDEAAARAARRMFDMQHFVVEDVLNGDLRDAGMIHSAI